MSTPFLSRNNYVLVKSAICGIITAFLLIAISGESLYAQPKLSVQGIVKKSNGEALEDGEYNITYNIYAKDGSPSGILWSETIPDVEVIGGIYSVILGARDTMLSLPFDQDYQLGVKIGTSELLPRIDLTSAPYAFALRGSSNQFPGSGQVLADSMLLNGGLKVLTKGGLPLFSATDSKVSIHLNNSEIFSVTPGNATLTGNTTVTGNLTTNNVTTNTIDIINNGSLKYNGLSDWRLVEVDNFDSDAEGWQVYSALAGQNLGWNSATAAPAPRSANLGNFIGNFLLTNSNTQVLKKQFSIQGSFTSIRVRFRYYFIDSWDFNGDEKAWAAFSTNVNGTGLRVGWQTQYQGLSVGGRFGDSFNAQANFITGTAGYADNWMDVEMTAKATGNSFWVFIGATAADGVANERFGVGDVEVYVR